MLVAPTVVNPALREEDIGVRTLPHGDKNDRFIAELQVRELAGPDEVARHITPRFTAETASGPRIREMSTAPPERAAQLRRSKRTSERLQTGPIPRAMVDE